MVNVGVIGLGIGAVHLKQLSEYKNAKIYALCDIDETKLNNYGEQYGVPKERRFTNYEDLISCDGVQAVEICTPNYLHTDMALKVISSGKPVQVEKPLDVSYKKAKEISFALKKNPVVNMTTFSYRYMPATRYAKEVLEKGAIGDIINVKIEYLKDSGFWKGRRLDWRFVKKYAGAGVIADLGAHLLDMAEFLVGEIDEVLGSVKVVVKERKYLESEEFGKVETDDLAQGMFKFKNGAKGLFNISRCAYGHGNHIVFDIYGTKGVISFDLNNPQELSVFTCENAEDGKKEIVKVPKEFYLTQEQAFVNAVMGNPEKYHPTIDDGLKIQKVIDAIIKSSKENKWIKI